MGSARAVLRLGGLAPEAGSAATTRDFGSATLPSHASACVVGAHERAGTAGLAVSAEKGAHLELDPIG